MEYYSHFVALHLMSILTWMGSLFLCYRLIYLQTQEKDPLLLGEAFFIFKRFCVPAFGLSILFGTIILVLNKGLLETGFWIYVKFLIISLIIIIHHQCKMDLTDLKNDTFVRKLQTIKYHSYMPFILVSVVILLTLIKPF